MSRRRTMFSIQPGWHGDSQFQAGSAPARGPLLQPSWWQRRTSGSHRRAPPVQLKGHPPVACSLACFWVLRCWWYVVGDDRNIASQTQGTKAFVWWSQAWDGQANLGMNTELMSNKAMQLRHGLKCTKDEEELQTRTNNSCDKRLTRKQRKHNLLSSPNKKIDWSRVGYFFVFQVNVLLGMSWRMTVLPLRSINLVFVNNLPLLTTSQRQLDQIWKQWFFHTAPLGSSQWKFDVLFRVHTQLVPSGSGKFSGQNFYLRNQSTWGPDLEWEVVNLRIWPGSKCWLRKFFWWCTAAATKREQHTSS